MSESLTIDKNNELPNALDYNYLRTEGIKVIERLSGKIWSDYNTHDPGITLLEAMCYALTDLGYRTSFDISDLLASPNKSTSESWKKLFYTAREALPCNPLTLIDYRKLIIDTEGVRNAWIEISDDYETLIYLQKTQKNPLTKQSYILTYDFKKGEDVLHLRGLYKVFIEYEDEVLEENRENEVAKVIWDKLQFHRNLAEDFLSISSVEYENFPIDAIIQVSEGTDIEMIQARIYKVIYDFFSPPVNFYSLEQMIEKNISTEDIFEGPILNYGFIITSELQNSERFKNIHLSDIIRLISGIEGIIAVKKFAFQSDSQSSYSNFTEWINDVKDKEKVPKLNIEKSTIVFQRSGDRHRGDQQNQADNDRVNAIFNFLKSDHFKTRLRGSGKDLPVPAGQFMDIADYYPFQKNLPAAYGMMNKIISKSDDVDRISVEKAVNELLVEKAGVHGAKLIKLLLTYKIDKADFETAIDNLVSATPHHAPSVRDILENILEDEANHKIIKKLVHELLPHDPGDDSHRHHLYKYAEENPEYISASHKTRLLQQLASKHIKKPLTKIDSGGEIAKLDALYKKHQVDMLDRPKKLVLQLRGFLMVFEQILSDYLSQLAHTREIFSFDEKVKQTFFPRITDGIEDLEALFIDYPHYKEFHHNLVETPEAFIVKRNNILDHLLARFSESMDKYAFFMQQFEGKEAGKRLIDDKIAFLSEYVQVSSYRGKGYNYADADNNWHSNNVEGVKKRICRLLGIKDYNRKKIAHHALSVKKVTLEKDVHRYVVTLIDPHNKETVLLHSIKEFEDENGAIIIATYILEHGYDHTLYHKEGHGEKWRFELKRLTPENDFETVAHSTHFNSSSERDEAFERTLNVLKEFSEDENFHVLEHILLRPKIWSGEKGVSTEDVVLLPVEYVPDQINASDIRKKDVAYKFKITHIKNQGKKNTNLWKLSLMKNNIEFLTVKDDFVFYKHLTRRMEHIRTFASEKSNYKPGTIVDGIFPFKIMKGETILAESVQKYRKEADYEDEVRNLINFLSYEHGVVTSPADENSPSFYADPYSFQLSVILPNWQRRFRNSTFKHLLEKMIYLETPSHIYPHVYWLDHAEMREFEKAYEIWIKEIAGNEIPATDVVNEMVRVLSKLSR